jgi:hypothetical protein
MILALSCNLGPFPFHAREEDIDGLGSSHQQRNVVLLQYQHFPLLLQNGEILLKDWHIGNGETSKDFSIEIMEMYNTCTLMQQNKKLKKYLILNKF